MRRNGGRTTAVRSGRWSAVLTTAALVATSLAVLGAAGPARAATVINVPADQPTIQAGIDAAVTGDSVVVAPGTYHEHIDFKGKAIEVRSASGPATTTIDGDNTNTVVVFKSGEPRAAILRGFTITHGLVAKDQPLAFAGGGIGIDSSSPTIVGNVVTANAAGGHSGAGIGALFGAALIQDNQIVANDAGQYGAGGGIFAGDGVQIVGNLIENNAAGGAAGVAIYGGTPTVRDNVIRGNHAATFNGGGLSIGGSQTTSGVYVDNLIVDNTADLLGGGVWLHDTGTTTPPYVLNNTIAGNQAPTGSAIGNENDAAILVGNVVVGSSAGSVLSCAGSAVGATVSSHNDFFNGTASPVAGCADPTGTNGNISADPRFVAPATSPADYRLQPGSPAIDAGDPAPAVSLPTADLAGAPRVADGNGDGIVVVDMGAYEAAATAVVGERFHPLVPARILDTRAGLGAPTAKVGPTSTLTLAVTGHGGVPATGVSAVVLNVTVTQPTAVGFLTAWPSGAPQPLASNLNFVPARPFRTWSPSRSVRAEP